MNTVTANDGTTIAFDAWGNNDGQPLIMIDGATNFRAVNPINAQVGELLREEFRVYAYDRRGRGDSTDTAPYAIQREIEDLAALIDHAGGSASAPALVFGWSSGGVLALDAAAAGLPISHLAVFEPPFVVDGGRPPLPGDYVQRLDDMTADGRPGDALALFMTAAVGLPAEAVAGFRQDPSWSTFEAVAHTIAYDGRIMGTTMSGNPLLPRDRWATISIPVLVMHGTATAPFLITAAHALSELLPTATLQPVEGKDHSAEAGVLAPALRQFAQSQ